MQIFKRIAIVLALLVSTVLVYAAASYPTSVVTFSTRANGQTIDASWFNTIQDEIVAIEGGLINGLAHDLKFTDGLFDIGKSGATRPRDLFLSRNAVVGGTLGVTGASTIAGLSATTGAFSSTLDVTGTATHSGATTLTGVATFTAAPVFNSGDPSFKVGASTETHKGAGIINVDSVQAATAANTTDTTLFSYTLPANALNADGRSVRFTAWGSFAANGNTKTVRLKWNGTAGTSLLSATVTSNSQNWVMTGTVIRTGSSSQDYFGTFVQSNNVTSAGFGTAAATDTGAITLHVTAQNGTASASDTVYEGSMIEFLN